MSIELLNPPGLYSPPTYSHVAIGRGRLVFVAGQVAYDANGALVGEGDLAAQARQAYENVATALRAAGARPDDVARLTTYVVDHGPGKIQQVMAGRQAVFGDHLPASTYLGVQALARPGILVEVEATAVVDE